MPSYDLNDNTKFYETDDSNTQFFREGMAPAQIDDDGRAIQGAVKRWYDRINPTQTSTGSANAFVLTYSTAPQALVAGDKFAFFANFSNTAASTLNINSLGAKALVRVDGTPLQAGDIVSGAVVEVAYNGTSFVMTNVGHAIGSTDVNGALGYTPANRAGDTFTGAVTAPSLTLSATPLSIANGGTGAVNAASARSNLNLGTAALVNTSGSNTWSGPQNFTGGVLFDNQSVNATHHGQCRLIFVSSTSIRLTPYDGNKLYVPLSGVMAIPSAGITVANTGLAAATTYFVYAFVSGGALQIEFSTTGHATDATTGIEIKSGDSTRVLVGMIHTNGSAQFADSANQRWVASWFNRRARQLAGSGTTTAVSGTVLGELNSGARVNFVCWATDVVTVALQSVASNDTAGQACAAGIGLDGVNITSPTPSAHSALGGYSVNLSHSATAAASEGSHFFTPMGVVSGGTGTFVSALNGTVWG